MIHIGSAGREMDERFLRAPGGFAWWYLDLVSPDGDGLVLIWSYGLPFLPGYADAARRGEPEVPVARPSVNLVVYRQGKPVFYLLQEHDPDPPSLSGCGTRSAEPGTEPLVSADTAFGYRRSEPAALMEPVMRIGASRFASRVEGGRRVVEARLDCGLPGTSERLTGTVRVDGVARGADGHAPDPPDEPHVWTPLTGPATGEAVLRVGERLLARLSGRAYHDRNGGAVPLHELGLDHWMWGRLPFAERERIYYLLWPRDAREPLRCIGVEIDAQGRERRLEALRVERQAERRTLAGLRWAERLRLYDGDRLWLEVKHRRVADSGPFYLRFLSEATAADGEHALGWGELCYPDRVDLAVHRPFVRMRVHRERGGNSMWLPLFTGPREDRVRRLLRHALTAERAG
jgi:carotenoid 1,2-hydratase